MRVLHINGSGASGGALGIAKSLIEQTRQAGDEAQLAYGFGDGGGEIPALATAPIRATQVSGRTQGVLNLVSLRTLGKTLIGPTSAQRHRLETLLEWSSLVHLHAVHGPMGNFHFLRNIIAQHRLPCVWTHHDDWAVTGRCTNVGGCELWRVGCPRCPNTSNFPKSLNPWTGPQWRRKRQDISQMNAGHVFVAPTQVLAARLLEAYPGIQSRVIRNAVSPSMWQLASKSSVDTGQADTIRVLVSGIGHSDPRKVDLRLLKRLSGMQNVEIVMIGASSLPPGLDPKRVTLIPFQSEPEGVAQAMQHAHFALVSGQGDTFPTFGLEASCFGIPVISWGRNGGREIVDLVGGLVLHPDSTRSLRPFFLEAMQRWSVSEREGLKERALRLFSPERMYREYRETYREFSHADS